VSIITRARRWLRQVNLRRGFQARYGEESRTARPGPHPLVLVLDHVRPFGNAGAIVRGADVFGARAVYVVGSDYLDPRPTMGSLRSVPLKFFSTFAEVHRELAAEGYTFFALEPARNFEAPQFLHGTAFPEKAALVVGNEKSGISFSPESFDRVICVTIAQYGKLPCLNVNAAASVAMYEYARQHGKPSDVTRVVGSFATPDAG
jgi:tRNA G18 (ribose-2'-O)-methylase SpoU